MLTNAIVSSTEGGLQQLVASLFLLAKAIGLMPMADQVSYLLSSQAVCWEQMRHPNTASARERQMTRQFQCVYKHTMVSTTSLSPHLKPGVSLTIISVPIYFSPE